MTFEINATNYNLEGDYHTFEIVLEPEGEDKLTTKNSDSIKRFIGTKIKVEEPEVNWNLVGFLIIILVVIGVAIYWWRRREIV